MKIGEIAQRTGLSVHTIRYYERIGLLPFATRDETGRRVYDRSVLAWIDFLGRLKTTGMSIQDMLRYAELRAQGAGTEPARKDLLVEHRDRVQKRIAELQACLLVLDNKISAYASTERGTLDERYAKAQQPPRRRKQT